MFIIVVILAFNEIQKTLFRSARYFFGGSKAGSELQFFLNFADARKCHTYANILTNYALT